MDGDDRRVARNPYPSRYETRPVSPSTNLADLLERVLDKGIVIAGDITLSLGTVEVLTLRLRLLVASIDKAREIGIDWWESDPALSSRARALEAERDELRERLDRLEARLGTRLGEATEDQAAATGAPASALDQPRPNDDG
ncbi:MAG TPA: gas vesicle protein [Thermomicrobiaceae bacterium]|nr:gas vesicle protein [Thermomicrobiaceae bacterium]